MQIKVRSEWKYLQSPMPKDDDVSIKSCLQQSTPFTPKLGVRNAIITTSEPLMIYISMFGSSAIGKAYSAQTTGNNNSNNSQFSNINVSSIHGDDDLVFSRNDRGDDGGDDEDYPDGVKDDGGDDEQQNSDNQVQQSGSRQPTDVKQQANNSQQPNSSSQQQSSGWKFK